MYTGILRAPSGISSPPVTCHTSTLRAPSGILSLHQKGPSTESQYKVAYYLPFLLLLSSACQVLSLVESCQVKVAAIRLSFKELLVHVSACRSLFPYPILCLAQKHGSLSASLIPS